MLEKIFKLSTKGTDAKTEIAAGIITFLTMSYILAVNSSILADTKTMSFQAVFFATALSAAFGTIMMGLYANLPFALAPGMGINAFFAYTMIITYGYTPAEALALVFVSGFIFLLVSFTGLRKNIIRAIPLELKYAIGSGIGFFIAFIGLKNVGIVVSNPVTYLQLGSLTSPSVLLVLLGVLLTIVLMIKKVHAALFISMVICSVIGVILGLMGIPNMPQLPQSIFSVQLDTSLVGAFAQGLTTIGQKPLLMTVTSIFSLLFMDFFDTAGTLIAVVNNIGIADEKGEFPGINQAFITDAVGTMFGSIVGTSTVTTFLESASGVAAGGRSGLTAVVTGLLFLVSIFLSPLFTIFNATIVAPSLIVVGVLMVGQLSKINFEDLEVAAPAFTTIIIMLSSFSIGDGIAAGFITYAFLSLFNSRREKNWTVYLLAFIFICKFALSH